ncbi:hypothetical protein Mgra_00005813 [Meloidogyne graminicola]|uniref:Uncharacterized protein n=1 Tax=Meloidogyne graminicola TaxID=189291 RepID=A0A8S9ZMY7_9BILA|nr:hypothetical protein Mgra_00005813 [Meloidogyne graminicola]
MDLTLVKVIDTLNIDAVQESIITLKDKGNDLERIKALIERILRTKALEFGCSTISIDKVDDFVKFVIGLAERDVNGIVVNNEKDNSLY